MNEVLKQVAEDVSKAYDVLAFAHTERALELLAKTRTSLRQAIEQAQSVVNQSLTTEQEPVAWMYSDDHERMLETETFCTVYSIKVGSPDKGVTDVPLYTSPPQRQPLTEQEIVDICDGTLTTWEQVRIARAIEAAHGIKGEA